MTVDFDQVWERIDTEGLPPIPDSEHPRSLPDIFWDARLELSHIRQAAHSRGRSADAVLAACLARVAADTTHTVRLPAIVGAPCGLTLIVGVAGPPGTGKSASAAISTALLPAQLLHPDCDGVPPGSGEGLIELLFDWVMEPDAESGKKKKVHRQIHHNAYVYIDEGETLTKLTKQTSNTFLPTIRSAFTSGVLGQSNASQERKRIVPAGQATYGIVLGIQPDLSGPLFSDAGAGTPQRFLWASSTSPTPKPQDRPDWPGPLPRPTPSPQDWDLHEKVSGYVFHELDVPDAVRLEIAERDHHRQQHGAEALEEHQDLIRLKVAGTLALLQGRLSINSEDWTLAGQVADVSRNVRHHLTAQINELAARTEAETSSRLARRQVEAVQKTHEWKTVETAKTLARLVQEQPGELTPGKLRAALSHNQREVFDPALDHAYAANWITEREEPGQGAKKRRLHPGETTP